MQGHVARCRPLPRSGALLVASEGHKHNDHRENCDPEHRNKDVQYRDVHVVTLNAVGLSFKWEVKN